MDTSSRFTDGRVPESAIRALYRDEHRWQRWLEVEAALAQAEAELDIIPAAAAQAITRSANLENLNIVRIHKGIRKTSHPLMALVSELTDAVGQPHGEWVHWGATTRNITQTGDMLVLREAHEEFLYLLSGVFSALEQLADAGAEMACAGRTHGQHAVPVTFGFKVAAWIDELGRHLERLHQVEPRVFTAMIGGAVGNYASFGRKGPQVQTRVAHNLGLRPMRVPYRATTDGMVEYLCVLGQLAGTAGKIAKEVFVLMQPEFGEAGEPVPSGTIGSSTMPHKRNPQLTDDCVAIAAQIRALVPLALESMLHDHEVSGGYESMMDDAMRQACVLTGDLLVRLQVILDGLELYPERMRANLSLTQGLITSEATMLALGEKVGRQTAHEIVYEAAQAAASGDVTFKDALLADPRVTAHLDEAALGRLLNPTADRGLSSFIAHDMAHRAHQWAADLRRRGLEAPSAVSAP
ncbi:MAG TPA: adenylosuccinate lyase family protein [Candidatus Saccharimonadia bacterium]